MYDTKVAKFIFITVFDSPFALSITLIHSKYEDHMSIKLISNIVMKRQHQMQESAIPATKLVVKMKQNQTELIELKVVWYSVIDTICYA